jgi:hypothetical protein
LVANALTLPVDFGKFGMNYDSDAAAERLEVEVWVVRAD